MDWYVTCMFRQCIFVLLVGVVTWFDPPSDDASRPTAVFKGPLGPRPTSSSVFLLVLGELPLSVASVTQNWLGS